MTVPGCTAVSATPLYERLVASAVPRPRAVVEPYVCAGTRWIARMAQGLGLVVVAIMLFIVVSQVGSPRASVAGALTGVGTVVAVGALLLAPVLLMLSVHRGRLRTLLRDGAMQWATVTVRRDRSFNGNDIPEVRVAWWQGTQVREAVFQGPLARDRRVGDTVLVIPGGVSVAVLWPPRGLSLAALK